MNSRWRPAAALAILLVLTAAFYWKLTLSTQWTYLEGPDLAIQVRPWLDLAAREFHAGRFPLWDPYEWAGHTLIGQVQPAVKPPLKWLAALARKMTVPKRSPASPTAVRLIWMPSLTSQTR